MKRSPSSSPSIAAQVQALCRTHPVRRKIVFVPRRQVGAAIEQAVARRFAGAWGGLSFALPRRYAERLAAQRLRASGRRALSPEARRFLAARLADEQEEADAFADLPGGPAPFAGTVAQATGALRANAAKAARVSERTEEDASSAASPARRVIARCYAAYERVLGAEQLYDEADVLRWGREALAEGAQSAATETVFAVVGDANLSEREAQLLHAASGAGVAFYRLGERRPAAAGAPAKTAAARFADAPLPGAGAPSESPSAPDTPEGTVCRAVGAGNEVRAAFRRMLISAAAFDEVEIALAQRAPYAGLVANRAEQAGVDVTFSTGRPALRTRTGQALRGFYEWIQSDFDPALLVGLLRDGLVGVEEEMQEEETEEDKTEGATEAGWSAAELATWLAGRRYEPGRAGYARAFDVALEDLERDRARLGERNASTERVREQRWRVRRAREIVTALLDLVPRGKTSVRAMAQASRRFLERFGPVDAPDPQRPEAERSLERAGRGVLFRLLGRLRELPITYEAHAGRLAAMLAERLRQQYVQAERPRPGAVHVVPLERAAFSGRPHLYVLGLDREAFASPGAEDDAVWHDLGDSPARQEGESGDAASWRAGRALRRHDGPLHLFASTYDVERGEERFPAAFFLEEEDRQAGDPPPATFRPNPDGLAAEGGEQPASERTPWLAAHGSAAAGSGPARASKTAREAACARYPWLAAAAAARAKQAAATYTRHDGLIGEGPFPPLDVTAEDHDGPPLSAGRLETFAETPYLYFLKYVLGVRPLDEPALDDAAWLDPLRHGSILHDAFERFMTNRPSDAGPARLEEADALDDALRAALAEAKRRLSPPSDRVEAAARRCLRVDARAFLRAEAASGDSGATPHAHEQGFGFGPRHARDDDFGETEIAFDAPDGGSLAVRLRGRIDRVDETDGGALAIWDYKTGRARGYEEGDLLAEGRRLQWALYAYVLAEHTGRAVARSGYFFTSAREMGARVSAAPDRYRDEVGAVIARLGRLARAGCFPMTPDADALSAWKWRGYEVLFPDLDGRADELDAKTYPDEAPQPLFL